MYNEAIHLADEAKDAATRDLLESILNEEDGTSTGLKNNWIKSPNWGCRCT